MRARQLLLLAGGGAVLIVLFTRLLGQLLLLATSADQPPWRVLVAGLALFAIRYLVIDAIATSGRSFANQLAHAVAGGGGDDAAEELTAQIQPPAIFPSLIDPAGWLPQPRRTGGGWSPSTSAPPPASRRQRWMLEGLYVAAFLLLMLSALLVVAAALLQVPATVKRYNFAISAIAVVGLMATVTWRRSFLALQTWKKIKEIWLVLPAVPTILILGFGAKVGTPEWLQTVVRDGSTFAQLSAAQLAPLALASFLAYLLASLLSLLGRAAARNEDSQVPRSLFVVVLCLAWVTNAGLYTLMLYGCVITACAYLPA